MTIGERIKERREYLGMSQEELALKLGYKSRASINKIEKNSRELRQQKIAEIAELLQTTPGYIMGWEQSEKSTFESREQKLKELILTRYSSLREFAIKIEMPYSTLDSILKRGLTNASIGNVAIIAKSLNLSIEDLYNGKTTVAKEVNIGDKIKRYRKERGLTQKELAESCGMFDSAIRRYESNRANPKLETLEKIANALNVNVTDLLDITTRSDLSTYTTKELLEELIRRAGD